MFRVGDRVVYTGSYRIHSKKYTNEEGVIVGVGRIPSKPQEQVFKIVFDIDDGDGSRSMYLANLKPIRPKDPDWEL